MHMATTSERESEDLYKSAVKPISFQRQYFSSQNCHYSILFFLSMDFTLSDIGLLGHEGNSLHPGQRFHDAFLDIGLVEIAQDVRPR